MSKLNNETLQSIIGSKTVAFHAVFAKALGSVPAAVMLSQAIFWQEVAKHKQTSVDINGNQYFQKTADDWFDETGLTKEQQATSRKILKGCDILKEERAGVPAKMHYHIDIESLVAVIYRYLNTGKTVRVDNRSKKRQNPRTSSGKFRQLKAVKNGNSYIESLESSESVREDAHEPSGLKTDATQKAPPQVPPPPSPESVAYTTDPAELEMLLRTYYMARPDDWKVIRERLDRAAAQAGKKYDQAKIADVVSRYCDWTITKGHTGWTFSQHHSRLRMWMGDQPSRETPAQTTTTAPAAVRKNMPVYGG